MPDSLAAYNAWYDTSRGSWIAQREFLLMTSMMQPSQGESLLDVGSGTGYFSRQFANAGLIVTGIDPDEQAVEFARSQSADISYDIGDARQLPYENDSFDYCSAVTSLCFVQETRQALQEMWRVSRKGVILGLLNRNSLLYRERSQHPGYIGARWDSVKDTHNWITSLSIHPEKVLVRSAVNFPRAATLSRAMEKIIPARFPFGSFLSVYLKKIRS